MRFRPVNKVYDPSEVDRPDYRDWVYDLRRITETMRATGVRPHDHASRMWEWVTVLRQAAPFRYDRVADIGGARSPLSVLLATLAREVVVIDVEPLDGISRDFYAKHGITYLEQDAQKDIGGLGRFDVVYSTNSIEDMDWHGLQGAQYAVQCGTMLSAWLQHCGALSLTVDYRAPGSEGSNGPCWSQAIADQVFEWMGLGKAPDFEATRPPDVLHTCAAMLIGTAR